MTIKNSNGGVTGDQWTATGIGGAYSGIAGGPVTMSGGGGAGSGSGYATGIGGTYIYNLTYREYLELSQRLSKIEEQLAILTPLLESHEKFESLKNAYEHYKLMEKLIGENE